MNLDDIILTVATDHIEDLREDSSDLSLVDRLTYDGAPEELRLLVAQVALSKRIHEDVEGIIAIPPHIVYQTIANQWPVLESLFVQVQA
jgi:hypothetical protein